MPADISSNILLPAGGIGKQKCRIFAANLRSMYFQKLNILQEI
jgi:hypothetical protein